MSSKPVICVFGSFQDTDLYQRNRVLTNAMVTLGTNTYAVRSKRGPDAESNHVAMRSPLSLIRFAVSQFVQFLALARQRSRLRDADVFFVPYPAYLDIWVLKLLTIGMSRRPVLVDAFLCLHDTVVGDRGMTSRYSFFARLVRWIERHALCSADHILIDTEQQKEQLFSEYPLSLCNIHVVPVGLDEDQWRPLPQPSRPYPFRVLFWGTFIPLHGVSTILEAARTLLRRGEMVVFEVVGDGQTADQLAASLKGENLPNFIWRRTLVDTPTLREAIARSHVVLGIFGDSNKADSVVPYKVQQALACNRFLITRESRAMRTFTGDRHDIALVPPVDSTALADAILDARRYLGAGGVVDTRSVYDRCMSNDAVKSALSDVLEALVE